MKKIGIYAEYKREAFHYVRDILGDNLSWEDIDKKYVYMNPLDETGYHLEKMRGAEFEEIYFASDRIQRIYEFFNYAKSRIR